MSASWHSSRCVDAARLRTVSDHGRRHRGAELRSTGAACCSRGEHHRLGPEAVPDVDHGRNRSNTCLLHIVKTLPDSPCRLEKTLSPAISSDRRRTAPMRIAAGPAIGARCPLDHDRQRALFSIYFSKAFQVTATDCSTGLRIFFLCDAALPRCDGQESTELFSLCPGGMRQASPDVCAVDEQPLRRC